MGARAAPRLKECATSLSVAGQLRLAPHRSQMLNESGLLEGGVCELPTDHSSPNDRPDRADGTYLLGYVQISALVVMTPTATRPYGDGSLSHVLAAAKL